MTHRLSQDATIAYYETTKAAYTLGFISWEQVIHRLAFLYTLIDDLPFKKKLFFIAEETIEEFVERDNDEKSEVTIEYIYPDYDSYYFYPTSHRPLVIQLTINNVSGLNCWEFNQYDKDFFPSIPHGHELNQNHKLDAYLGWIYQKSTQVGREPRKLIIELWNNDKFRSFAIKSLNWYENLNPNFKWRVPYPLRIPRKRK